MDHGEGEGSTCLPVAIRTAVIVDSMMSLDNGIAIAAAAPDNSLLLARFPLMVLAGGGGSYSGADGQSAAAAIARKLSVIGAAERVRILDRSVIGPVGPGETY